MSRNNPRGYSQDQAVARRGHNDPNNLLSSFGQMQQQLMRGFGGLHDDFFSDLMKFEDPSQSMFKFSDMHQKLHGKGVTGTYVCQSYVQSSKMGPDGKVITENYYENNLGQHRNGNTISEKQQAYKNTAGVNRLAEERMLNDMGRKVVKERRGNEVEETNHYYNIDAEGARDFDDRWNRVNQENKFLQEYGKYLGYGANGRRAVGYDRDYEPRQQAERPAIKASRQSYTKPQPRPALETKSYKPPSDTKSHTSNLTRNSKFSSGSRRNPA